MSKRVYYASFRNITVQIHFFSNFYVFIRREKLLKKLKEIAELLIFIETDIRELRSVHFNRHHNCLRHIFHIFIDNGGRYGSTFGMPIHEMREQAKNKQRDAKNPVQVLSARAKTYRAKSDFSRYTIF